VGKQKKEEEEEELPAPPIPWVAPALRAGGPAAGTAAR